MLNAAEAGTPVAVLCRQHGMDAFMMFRLKELEEENRRLKKMCAERVAPNDMLPTDLLTRGCFFSTIRKINIGDKYEPKFFLWQHHAVLIKICGVLSAIH